MTREEMYLASLLDPNLPLSALSAITRNEIYYQRMLLGKGPIPEPLNRQEAYLAALCSSGGGGGGGGGGGDGLAAAVVPCQPIFGIIEPI